MTQQEKKQPKQSKTLLEEILDKGDKAEIRALFSFNTKTPEEEVLFKAKLWARYFFPDYFLNKLEEPIKDAPFHKEFDRNTLRVYRGEQTHFVNAGFRGCSKTTKNKLFIAFCVSNDENNYRRFIKILASDISNAKQFTTDIYNMFIGDRYNHYYPELFQKSNKKREETMSTFTTHTGVKVSAGTVGTEQRGDVQEDSRPDFILYTDIETRKTLRSAVITKAIWDNMEEARTGLAKGGGCIYEGNYLSERGNIHKLIKKRDHVMITPIIKDGKPTWASQYTLEDIERIRKEADDFAGEYLCEPSIGADVMFDRSTLNTQTILEPIKVLSGFKIFYEFNPAHLYGLGADVAGGVGLDHSTTVIIDFTQNPNRVVATFKDNFIKPDVFGDEIQRQGEIFGNCIVAPEANNHGHATIGRLKQIYQNIYQREISDIKKERVISKDYGWITNGATKPKMLFDLRKAVEDGHLLLIDEDIIEEMKSYTRDDLMDKEIDPRLTTRHFDLVIACAIAWQMRKYADKVMDIKKIQQKQDFYAAQTRKRLTKNTR